ncbi:NAD+ synthase [Rhodobacterales bacterium 52_120_T64]|nr:NAD+ synthase [Rhodobacterales bacterium 52_120_T64]
MSVNFCLSLCQLNPTVGDIAGNAAKAVEAHKRGTQKNADLVALPEMFLTGYQTQDLVTKPAFLDSVADALEGLAADCANGPALGIGAPVLEDGKVYNAYYVLKNGKIHTLTRKHHLPNTQVFDEQRLFESAQISGPFSLGPIRVGTPICEDAWHEDVCETMAESGAELLLVPNGSPYYSGKFDRRINHMVSRVVETGLPLIYLNMVGGQDDQIFDGGSFVLNPGGKMVARMPLFDEAYTEVYFEQTPDGWRALDGDLADHPSLEEQEYRAMVEGLRDYMRKTGFSKVILGLSGGVDSAIVATIAADALGPENVHCVMMPSEYTSQESLDDAADVAASLGCRLDNISISEGRAAITNTLAPLFEGFDADITEENIQSRLRGLLLMAMSNKFGAMLLTTGNKSEVAVGYATIYGDMAGGYNPIKDLYKTRVFATCRWRNENYATWMKGPEGAVIPVNIIEKPPTAELREDQKDEDSLPPYDVLDGILTMLMEGDAAVSECVAAGYDRDTVKKVEHLLYISEYKRFQSAPGPRLTKRAFWLDRRYPIANRWRDPS